VKVSAKMTTTEKNFILIQEFPTIKIASDYISAYKAGSDVLDDLQDNKIFIITQENLKKLIETAKFDEYKLFYDDNY
jgi:2-phosphoglycerate kinase